MVIRGEQSVVKIRVLVDATGHVTKCTSISHFMEAEFNRITCSRFTAWAHFRARGTRRRHQGAELLCQQGDLPDGAVRSLRTASQESCPPRLQGGAERGGQVLDRLSYRRSFRVCRSWLPRDFAEPLAEAFPDALPLALPLR